ncbi:GntR family transcriptional regulator [Candidatus Frankia alpina]|uniref:FadR/GntR family transcriptional regulator n=1 Tax=Candidatus Frankia alpina TaxID=2699483 RepID=UPI001968456E
MARPAAPAASRPGTSQAPSAPAGSRASAEPPGSPPPIDDRISRVSPPLPVSAVPVGRRVRVPKTAELVASQLRRRIIRGELTEGDALPPEPTLMTQFGVSRPTLREAFRVLEAEALISVRRGAHGGARVHLPSPTVAARYAGLVLEHRGATLGDVHQASAIIEPPCAALLAERHDAVDVSVLRGILAEADEVVDDPTALAAAQAAFHLAVVELTGNKSLSVVTGMLQHLVELTSAQHGHAIAGAGPDASPASAAAVDRAVDNRLSAGATRQLHAALVDLVEIGDAAGADRHWRQHLAAPDHAIPGGPADRCVLDLLG